MYTIYFPIVFPLNIKMVKNYSTYLLLLLLLLSLVPQPSLGLGLLHKIRLDFLEASQ
jgi:hypothetical protein